MGEGVVGRYGSLADEVFARPARVGPVRVVAVDGRAGSGKTTFARRLAGELGRRGRVEVLHTDDMLDGWAELLSWYPRLRDWVLEPLRRGEGAAWRRYDWGLGRLVDEWTRFEAPDVLLVEGVGTTMPAMRGDLTLGVVVHAPRELRMRRGIERDGEALRGEWIRWMALEDEHFARNEPAAGADVVVDGAPAAGHDPEVEYIGSPGGWTGGATLEDDPESGTDGEGLSG